MLVVERALDRPTAIVAGVMLAVLPGPIMWTDFLTSETVYTALFVVMMLVVLSARPTWRWVLVIALLIGISALVRGEALTWMLLPIAMWWKEVPRRRLARLIGSAIVVVGLVLAPWTIRNAVVMDAFVPLATNASQTLWSGHNATATGGQVYPPPGYNDRFPPDLPESELQSSKALRNEAIEYMFTHPLHELELIPLKLIHLNRGDSYGLDWINNAGGSQPPPISPINAERVGVIADAGYFSLLALTLLGAFVLGRAFWRAPIGRVIATSLLTALFLYGFLYYGNYRYRLPYEPMMVIVAATVVTRLWRSRRVIAEPSCDQGFDDEGQLAANSM
jgi:hypothetical protein